MRKNQSFYLSKYSQKFTRVLLTYNVLFVMIISKGGMRVLYQKLLSGEYPYKVRAGSIAGFQKHRHPEVEIAYCIEGSYDIVINNTCYYLKKGDLAIIDRKSVV